MIKMSFVTGKTCRILALLAAALLSFYNAGRPDLANAQSYRQSASQSAPAGPQLMTLQEAVKTGVFNNPEYGKVANNRRATDEELNQAEALYLPSIDARADAGVEYSDNPSTRVGNDDSETLGRYDVSLTLTQLLFDGWETYYENKRQEFRVTSAAHRVRETSELVGLAVVRAYLDVMRRRELLRIARQNVADHVKILDQVQDSARAGRTTRADVAQVRARLATARAQQAEVRQQLDNAEADFILEVGVSPADLQMPAIPRNKLSSNVQREVETTLIQNPTLEIFEADVQVANAEYKQSKSSFYPDFNLQMNARDGENLGGVDGDDTSASALVVMNWNLYRGGSDVARSREFINRAAEAKEARAEAARGIENDVRQTWAQMMASRDRVVQFARQVQADQSVVRAYKDQFDLNRRTLLDVLDAQNELFVSKSNQVNSEFLEIFAVFRLIALRGELLPTLAVNYPAEANPDKI